MKYSSCDNCDMVETAVTAEIVTNETAVMVQTVELAVKVEKVMMPATNFPIIAT